MIIQSIDKYLKGRPKDERAIHCFHPSSLHKPVEYLVKAYFEGDSEHFEPRVLRIFDNGKDVHERLQRYLEDIKMLKQTEIEVWNEEYKIQGHADGLVEIGGLEGVLEIKSINANGFYGGDLPKPEHVLQINVYMFCLGVPRGVILYECKNDQELKEFFVKSDEQVLQTVLFKVREAQERIKDLLNTGTKQSQSDATY